MKKLGLIVFPLAILVGLFWYTSQTQAQAVTCLWTGESSANFSDADNWSDCEDGIPDYDDNVSLPQAGSNKSINLDISPTIQELDVTGSGYSFERTDTEELRIGTGFSRVTATQDITFNVPVYLGDAGSFSFILSATGKTITFNESVTIFADRMVTIGDSDVDTWQGKTVFNGNIHGLSGTFAAINGATAEVNGTANDYQARSVGAGPDSRFTCNHATCFGNSVNIMTEGGVVEVTTDVSFSGGIIASSVDKNSELLITSGTLDIIGNGNFIDGLQIVSEEGGSANFWGTTEITANQNLHLMCANNEDTIGLYGDISGEGGLIVQNCNAIISGSNLYGGETIIRGSEDGAVVTILSDYALGDPESPTIVEDGATLQIDSDAGNITVHEFLSVQGTGSGGAYNGALMLVGGSSASLTQSITLENDTAITNNDTGFFILAGKITGPGALTLSGNDNNGGFGIVGDDIDYEGDTLLRGAQLLLEENSVKIPGDITVEPIDDQAASIVILSNEQIADDATITLNGSTASLIFYTSLLVESIGTIQGNGRIVMDHLNNQLNVGGADKSGTFSGVLEGGMYSGMHKNGSGNWNFTGTHANPGNQANIVVNDGSFSVNSTDVSSRNWYVGTDGGVLKGSGHVGSIFAVSGGVAPGNSPGCLTPSNNVTFVSGSSLDIEITGETACTEYDQINASGAVDLGGATLNVALSYVPAVDTVFTIIEGSAVTGVFAGLADGATIDINNARFRINYSPTLVTLTTLESTNPVPGPNPGNDGFSGTETVDTDSSSSDSLANTGLKIFAFTVLAGILIIGAAIASKLPRNRSRFAKSLR